MKKHLVWAAVLGITALVSVPLMAENASSKGVKGAADAKDSNVRSTSIVNPEHPNVAAPESKGAPKTRGLGGTCNIHVDNHTPYYIQFYFNGNAAGAMGPWGDLYPNITQGSAVLYAKATFTDGSVMTFGPRDLTCTGGDFTWTLTP